MIKLLIFDLDGTLADTAQDIANAINYAVEPFGLRKFSVEETKAMVGSGISKLLESLLPVKDDNSKEVVTRRFLGYYAGHILDNTKAYPFVKETLPKLGNYKKAVVSNKRETLSKGVLEGLGLSEFFEVVFGSDSVPEKKPSPAPMLKLLEKFGVTRDEAVVIGDSNYDIEAGQAAGIKTVAVTYGFRRREVLKDADFTIDRFDELLNILSLLSKTTINKEVRMPNKHNDDTFKK
ncbi:MAG: HAD-IA family hydrolase [Nitrospirae bacterium]|nr:HAD-IA family hydrolase [Nitrospirota bacterium]